MKLVLFALTPAGSFFRVFAKDLAGRWHWIGRAAADVRSFAASAGRQWIGRRKGRSGPPAFGWRLAASFFLAFSAAGCSLLPGNGPTGMAIQSDGEVSTGGYAVVDIDLRVIDALKWRSEPTFKTLSEYKPASAPVIGTGDTIQVTVWEAAPGNLFTTVGSTPNTIGSAGSTAIPAQVVPRSGTINVPFAGDIKVAGKSPREVEKAIVGQLNTKAVNPQALVNVIKSADNSVTVTGDAVTGGQVQLSPNNESVLQVIAEAGGIKAPVHDTFVSVARGTQVVTVSYMTLTSSPAENIRLSPRDVLNLYSHKRTYTVFGAALRGAEVPFDAPTVTLAQALARAGLDDEKADASNVFVLRFEPGAFMPVLLPDKPAAGTAAGRVPVIYRLNLRDPKGLFLAQSFYMNERDMIYISNAPGAELSKVLRIFGGAAGPVGSGASIYNAVR